MAVLLWLASLVPAYLATAFDGWAALAAASWFVAIFAVGETFISASLQPLVVMRAPAGQLGAYSAAVSLMFGVGLIAGPALMLGVYGSLGVNGYWTVLALGIGAALPLLWMLRNDRSPVGVDAT
jgi:hypothetical protein